MLTVSLEEAIEVANDTDYGLTASVFTGNGTRTVRHERLKRAPSPLTAMAKASVLRLRLQSSGFGGRDNGIHAHEQYTELKTIWIDLSDTAPTENVGE